MTDFDGGAFDKRRSTLAGHYQSLLLDCGVKVSEDLIRLADPQPKADVESILAATSTS